MSRKRVIPTLTRQNMRVGKRYILPDGNICTVTKINELSHEDMVNIGTFSPYRITVKIGKNIIFFEM